MTTAKKKKAAPKADAPETATRRGFGYLPGYSDSTEKALRLFKAPSALPDASPDLPLVPYTDDQSAQGSCTGQSISNAANNLYLRKTHKTVELSARFTYLLGRLALNNLTLDDYIANPARVRSIMLADTGAMIRDVVRMSRQYGFASATLCPYVLGAQFADLPSPDAIAQANRHLALEPQVINEAADLRVALHEGHAVVLGFTVPSNFDDAGTSGSFARPTSFLRAGHAVEAVKHIQSKVLPGWSKPGAVLLRNSWGRNWGIPHPALQIAGRGFFWMSDEFIDSPEVSEITALVEIK